MQIVEKAFAKLHGCYEAIISGSVSEALQVLTGGKGRTLHLHGAVVRLLTHAVVLLAAVTSPMVSAAAAAVPLVVVVVVATGEVVVVVMGVGVGVGVAEEVCGGTSVAQCGMPGAGAGGSVRVPRSAEQGGRRQPNHMGRGGHPLHMFWGGGLKAARAPDPITTRVEWRYPHTTHPRAMDFALVAGHWHTGGAVVGGGLPNAVPLEGGQPGKPALPRQRNRSDSRRRTMHL